MYLSNNHFLPAQVPRRTSLNNTIIKVIATGFGTGFIPIIPGTVGTVVGIPLYLILSKLPWGVYFLLTAGITVLACVVSHKAALLFHQSDPPMVVIDEIAGFLWTMFLVKPTVAHVLGGFILFRFFDVIKVFPAGYFQKQLPGGFGIVADDLIAGMYSNVVLLSLIHLWGI